MPHKRKNAKAARSAPEGFSLAFLQQCGMGNKARSEEISFGGRKKILKFLSDLIGATPRSTTQHLQKKRSEKKMRPSAIFVPQYFKPVCKFESNPIGIYICQILLIGINLKHEQRLLHFRTSQGPFGTRLKSERNRNKKRPFAKRSVQVFQRP